MVSREKKAAFMARLGDMIDKYDRIVLVDANNVSSKQMNAIRMSLRGKAELIMGKNTIIRKVMRTKVAAKPDLAELIPIVAGNLGMVFTNGEIKDIREIINSHKEGAPAKVGAIAPLDVFVPAGPTGLEPTMTSFFAALAIPTMINKGSIDITEDVHLVTAGTKVGSSEATLLQKLDIRPFSYGLDLHTIYDAGLIYSPKVLDITNDDIVEQFRSSVEKFAKVSLAISHPVVASVPLLVRNAMAAIVKVSVATGHAIEQTTEMIAYLADPEAWMAENGASLAAAAEEKKDESDAGSDSESSSDDDMGFGGLF